MADWVYGLGIGLRAAIMARGRRPGPSMAHGFGLGLLWLPEGQYLGHTTTSNHIYKLASRLNLDFWVNQAIMGFPRPLWILLRPLWVGHYELCFPSHIAQACMAIKGNNKHSQLIIIFKALYVFCEEKTELNWLQY